jgi:hypothetical protein
MTIPNRVETTQPEIINHLPEIPSQGETIHRNIPPPVQDENQLDERTAQLIQELRAIGRMYPVPQMPSIFTDPPSEEYNQLPLTIAFHEAIARSRERARDDPDNAHLHGE